MLPKGRRLTADEVQVVLSQGRSSRAGNLSMKRLLTKEPLRFAAVVSKSVAKKAVARNRIRRALYRALTPFSGEGQAIIFVRTVPEPPLTPAFGRDLAQLLSK
jgi:ribonuclease P protein component